MTTEEGLGFSQRAKINKHRCVVCGAPSVCCKSRLFYQTGRCNFGAPFCKEHAAHYQEYAQPIFENTAAQELFQYMHPQTYQKSVEGKPILYFSSYKCGVVKTSKASL